MRSKLVLAALAVLTSLPVMAQVAPAVKISGLPLGVGFGLSDYNTDYYPAVFTCLEWSDDWHLGMGGLRYLSRTGR